MQVRALTVTDLIFITMQQTREHLMSKLSDFILKWSYFMEKFKRERS